MTTSAHRMRLSVYNAGLTYAWTGSLRSFWRSNRAVTKSRMRCILRELALFGEIDVVYDGTTFTIADVPYPHIDISRGSVRL